jgi:repressor LexA
LKSFAERLKVAIELSNLKPSELSAKTGLSQSLISQYLGGRFEAKNDKISVLAEALNVDESWLAGFSEDLNRYPSSNVTVMQSKIHVYGRITAGVPFEAIQDILEDVEVPSWLAEKKGLFGLKVVGDSMNKVIPDGAIAVLQKTHHLENGDIGAVMVNGYDATLKKFFRLTDSVVLEPLSFNPDHEPIVIKDGTTEVQTIGKLVWFCAAQEW